MSTKLYDGLRVKNPQVELFSLVELIAEGVRTVFNREAQKLVSQELAMVFDSPKEREQLSAGSYLLFHCEDRWLKHQEKLGSQHTLNDPLRFSIVFGKSFEGNVLAYPYHTTKAYGELLEGTGLFEEYGYWNNTDGPDELTEDQWRARGKEWDSIANDEGTFGDLPMWQLGNSNRPFSQVYIYARDFDPNQFLDRKQRLSSILTNELLAIGQKTQLLSGDASNFYSEYLATKRAVKAHMEELGEDLELPPLLPADLFELTAKELPDAYEPSEKIMRELSKRLQEELSSKS